MAYICQLKPPHVGPNGQAMAHKNRKECIQMGLNNRGQDTHPERFLNAGRASAVEVPPSNNSASSPGSGPGSEGSTPSGGTAKPKRKFTIFKKAADAPPEGSPEQKALDAPAKFTLSGDLTVRFWTTIMSFAKSGVQFLDKAIHAKHPYDTKHLEFTTAEEEMIAETMPGITTRIVKWFGAKSLEEAERIINALVILRVFGRIFVSLGLHFADELKAKAKEKRDAKKQEEVKTALAPPPSETPPAATEPEEARIPVHPRRPSPAEMERMALISQVMVPEGAQ